MTTTLLLACQKCSRRFPELHWKHKPINDSRYNRNVELYYAYANLPSSPVSFARDRHCNWSIHQRGVDAFTCAEFGPVWQRKQVGVDFLDHDDDIMYTQRPDDSVQAKLAANAPPSSVIPPQVSIPPNSGMGEPLGFRQEKATVMKDHQQKVEEENKRHAAAMAAIERDYNVEYRAVLARWGRR